MVTISESVVETFERDGAAVLHGALSAERIELLAAGVEHNRTHPSPWSHW